MTQSKDYTAAFLVDATPEAAFAAINNVRGWWSGEIEGDTDKVGAEFTYRYEDIHYSKQKVTESIPGKRVVWLVLDSQLNFVEDKSEWTGTRVMFEIGRQGEKTQVRFTHMGLVPGGECYSECSNAWGSLIHGNLRNLITTGQNQPNLFASKEAGTQ